MLDSPGGPAQRRRMSPARELRPYSPRWRFLGSVNLTVYWLLHCSGLDMRQNSDVHEEVVAELLAWVGVHSDYMSLSEPERVELLAAELATRRPLTREHTHLSELARKELDILAAAARGVHCSVRTPSRTTSSRCAGRCRTCWRPRSC